jgi:hypothetical protein
MDPTSLPLWAGGLGTSIEQVDGSWTVQTPSGPVKITFVEKNPFRVADHAVHLPQGTTVHVPMRVLANGAGSEVLFTLFRQPGMSDAQYASDAVLVEQDLRSLRLLLESERPA